MRHFLLTFIVLLPWVHAPAAPLRILTDRTESHLRPLLELYQQKAGVKVEAVYADRGMLTRLETRPSEADLVISSTAETLDVARSRRLLAPFESAILQELAEVFRGPGDHYLITSYRPRCFFYHPERVHASELSTYAALVDPKWKGRISIRSGYHPYNLSFLCQMASQEGLDATRAFLAGLKANLARAPQGNDRAQVQAIYEGNADLSIGNAYYMPLMLANEDQRPWGEATAVFFPNQNGKGAYVMRSGAALTTADRHRKAATQLLEFLVSDAAQIYFARTLHVHPVKEGVPLSQASRALGKGQPQVKDGRFKASFTPVPEITRHREAVIALLNEFNFDG